MEEQLVFSSKTKGYVRELDTIYFVFMVYLIAFETIAEYYVTSGPGCSKPWLTLTIG